MQSYSVVLALLLALSGAWGAQDYHYCGHEWKSRTFYEALTNDGILVTNPAHGSGTGLLVTDSTADTISLARPQATGTFQESTTNLNDATFCDLVILLEKLYSADLDGNGQDDLLCQKADGTFVAKMSSNSNYKRPSSVAKGFNCPIAAHQVHLGDFDGNGAADILCAADNRLSYTIYFNSKSKSSHYGYHDYNRKSIYDHFNMRRHKRHTRMPTLPMAYSLVAPFPCPFSGTAPSIIVADVNGDKRDDIVCHNVAAVSYHMSNGKPSPTILASGSVATALANCNTATLLAADVDGDGDDDLVCLPTDVSLNVLPVLIAYSTGEYATDFSLDTTCVPFCVGVAGSTLAQFRVGDFNGDGKEDILCRYLDPTGPTWFTSIIFAERKP